MPTVSIVIPTYNRSDLLKVALISCLEQTYRDFEVIVVDDGSTDDTKQMVESLNSEKVQYIYQENCGRSKARNNGIAQARGKYITFLDSDDIYLPQKLAVQVKTLDQNPAFGMVYSSAFNVDIDGEIHPYVYPATASGNIYKEIALYLPLTICLPTVMARREVFEKVGVFDERQNRFEDTDMWRRISKQYKILAIEEPLCKIRYHEGNEMEHPDKIFKALKYYTEKVLREDTLRYGFHLRFLAAHLCAHYGLAVHNHVNPAYQQYSHHFIRLAFKYSPLWCLRRGLTYYLDKKTAAPILGLMRIRRGILRMLELAKVQNASRRKYARFDALFWHHIRIRPASPAQTAMKPKECVDSKR